MNQGTKDGRSTRMLRCKRCGCTQERTDPICRNCGEDLMLFGEFVQTGGSETGAAGMQSSPSSYGTSKLRKPGKRLSIRKIAWIAVPVCAAVAAAGIFLALNNPADGKEPGSQGNAGTPPASAVAAPEPTDGSQSGPGNTVAGEADLSGFNRLPANAVPDLYYWSNGQATYRDEPSKSDKYYYDYKADEALIHDYIAMLQNNGFTLVDSYSFSYKGSSFYSWGFCSDAVPDAQRFPLKYKDTPCHVSLYYADSKGKYTMIVSPDLQVCDTGLRYDGSTVDLRPGGPSAAAGLVQLADGSYQTSDGRLTASLGTAMVLRDGAAYTTNASYKREKGKEVLRVENYYRNEGIYFRVPEYAIVQGDIFTQREIRRWRWNDCTSMDQVDGFNWGTKPALVMPKDTVWLGASYNEAVYEAQTVRVMYYDDGGTAVFYIYSSFRKGEPKEVEALCVVQVEEAGSMEDATYVKTGNITTVKYTHHEFGTQWETYEWKILEGQDKISINAMGDTCDVTAKSPGVASVQVTYGYSKEEPDVLTGIMRTVGHSMTETYRFVIE